MAAVLGTSIGSDNSPAVSASPVCTRDSTSRTGTEASPVKSNRGCRRESYGTFIPAHVFDSEHLKRSLFAGHGKKELSQHASGSVSYAAIPPDIFRHSGGHSFTSSEPAVTVPSGPINENNETQQPDFFTECELEVKKLFNFMELHLSKLEDDLAHVVKRRESRGRTKSDCKDEGLAEDEPVEKSTSELLDSRMKEGHMQTELGILSLQRLKDIAIHLLESLHNSFTSLDELMRVHDDSYCSEDGRDFLQSKLMKMNEVQGRLNACVTSISFELKCFDQDDKEDRIDGLETPNKRRQIFADVRATPVSCFTYLYLLLLLVVMGILSWMYFTIRPRWVVYLRLVRSPLVLVMYFYLLGINMKTWAYAGIDYISIFNFPPKGVPTPKYAFVVGRIFTAFFSTLVALLLITSEFADDIVDKVITFVMWLSLLGFILNPLNVYLRRGRLSFILVCVRVVLSPLHYVYFGDLWFADQLNSVVAILLDIQYFVCYVSNDTWTKPVDKRLCTSSSNGIRPIISCLPALWRFFQCLRRFYDTRQTKQLFNAVKYFTTFPVVLFATLFSITVPSTFSLTNLDLSDVGWIVVCWVLASFVHMVYTFFWDVYYDWGLFRIEKGTLLRPKRLYRWRIWYYLAIVVDLILRCTWVVKLTLAIVWHLDTDLLYTVLFIGEIMRRFIWNFFRVEFEQVRGNSTGGKASHKRILPTRSQATSRDATADMVSEMTVLSLSDVSRLDPVVGEPGWEGDKD